MNRTYVAVLAAGAVVIALTAWLTAPGRPKVAADPSKYRYMHCPQCERERMYSPAGIDQPCQYCEKRLVPTEKPLREAGGSGGSTGLMGLLIAVEVVALMGAILVLAHRRTGGADDEYLYIACDKCRQKIRYQVRQVGHPAMCRRCRHAFRYPEPDPDDA